MKTKSLGVFLLIILLLIISQAIPALALEPDPSIEVNYEDDGEPIWTNKQHYYHEVAETAREMGQDEDSPLIKACQQLWWEEQQALNILAKLIKYEAGSCPWLHRIAVGQAVINRVHHPNFPNTVFDVVNASGTLYDNEGNARIVYQYNPAYCYNFNGIERTFYYDAKFVLDGYAVDRYVPCDIIWQAEFPQGKEVWWRSEVTTEYGFHSVTFFCR